MSEDDKKLCYRAIELMRVHGAITRWTAESLEMAVRQNGNGAAYRKDGWTIPEFFEGEEV